MKPFPKAYMVASAKTWIEDAAIEQLRHVSQLSDIQKLIAMADLHPSKTYPNGMIAESQKLIYPALIGGDIGCGVGLWQTTLKSHKIKVDKWVKSLSQNMESQKKIAEDYSHQMGSIGGGNHFAELTKIIWLCDDYSEYSTKNLYILVHSGSRGLGGKIQHDFLSQHGYTGIDAQSSAGQKWLKQQDKAIAYGENNRAAIAEKMADILHTSIQLVNDNPHNLIKNIQDKWVHYKGATHIRKNREAVMILGSRGAPSYLVQPTKAVEDVNYGLAHGAGRKWARTNMVKRLSKYKHKDLTRTELKSHVICHDKQLLIEEAPQAYKNIEQVINDLTHYDLCKPIAKFEPIITFKKGGDFK